MYGRSGDDDEDTGIDVGCWVAISSEEGDDIFTCVGSSDRCVLDVSVGDGCLVDVLVGDGRL